VIGVDSPAGGTVDPDLLIVGAALVVLWITFGRSHRATRVRTRVGNRPKARFWSWWPVAVLALAVMIVLGLPGEGIHIGGDNVADTTGEGP
jgi:hypothetical protein